MRPLSAVVGPVALLLGLLLVWVSATNLSREREVQRRAVRLPGEVVGAEWKAVGVGGGEPGQLLSFPVVRYADPGGQVRTFLADVGTGLVTPQGTPVQVLHDPSGRTAPQLAGAQSRAVLPAGFLALGVVLALVGAGLLLSALS